MEAKTQETGSQRVPFLERISYTTGMLGQNIIFNYVNSFLSMFYTDIMLLAPSAVGALFFITRIWDGVNDPIMGGIADRTRSRFGKFRPYLMLFSLPIGLISVMCFTGSGLPMGTRLLYAYVTYIAWDMLYTACDIPIWGLSSVISGDPQQRTVVLSWIKVGATVGAGVVLVFGIQVLGAFGGTTNPSAYWKAALLLCGVGAVAMLAAGFATRERIMPPKDNTPFLKNFTVIYKNKPLMALLVAMLVSNFAGGVRTTMQVYYAKYVLMDESLLMGIAAAAIGLMLVGMAITPALTKRYSNKTLFIFSTLGAALFHLLAFFAGYRSLTVLVTLLALGVGFTGINTIVMTALLIDAIEFAKRKLGIRGEGVAFSTQTLVVKISSAIAAALALAILEVIKFAPNLQQTELVMNGMHALMFLAPAVAYGLAAIPIVFFKSEVA